MATYSRAAQRFFFTGISAFPPDGMPPGKLPFGRNVRSYQEGVIQTREGLTPDIDAPLGSAVHTLARLNDSTPFNGGVAAIRVIGAGAAIFTGDPTGTSYAQLDTGYSGDPLSTLTAQPPRSPRPYIYVADSDRQRKFLSDGAAVPTGIAQPSSPNTEPLVQVEAISTRILAGLAWALAGVAASAPVASVPIRIDTVIGQILYDDGVTGYASVAPDSFTDLTVGTLLIVGGETGVVVTDLTIGVASTTVEAIIYDSGVTGPCTIQPVGSLGTGQLEAPSLAAYQRRSHLTEGTPFAVRRGEAGVHTLQTDPDQPTKRIRQMDFPVNALVTLNGVETVRILSVAIGPDGTQSFRCSTATTIAAGHTIEGVPGIRVFLTGTHAPGEAIQNTSAVTNTLTYPTLLEGAEETITRMTGGVQATAVVNLSQFSDSRAVLPDDTIHVAVKIDRMTEIVSIRVYFDVDPVTNGFLQNYYFYEWRASDIISAIQATNSADVTPLATARATVVANRQLEGSGGTAVSRTGTTTAGTIATSDTTHEENIRRRTSGLRNQPAADSATTSQLALGNNQWIDLTVRVHDLVHVGTSTSRSLANVEAVEVLVSAAALGMTSSGTVITPDPLTVEYGDIWAGGGAGPDVGDVGDPYVYTYRYRSSESGVFSNPAPPSRGGVIPKRQGVLLTPVVSTHPECDKIDWFRLGSTLTGWRHVGTGENSTTPYEDLVTDSAIDGGTPLLFDQFQPWPTQDLPRAGTCDVAGTAVFRVGGDAFDTDWAPGSPLIINGRVGTLYASPASTDLLHVNENLLSGSAVPFAVMGATKLSQNLRTFWGDFQNIWFGCGDPDNPGTLYWTHGNNPESASDAFALLVTPPSEPLQNGGVYNVLPFVFSSENLYELVVSQGPFGPSIRAVRTPCGRGLWTSWAWTLGVEGIYFLAGDGIYLTAGGSPAKSITGPDLRAIFPKDGVPGVSINGIPAPDMSETTRLRLSYIAGYLYFDYRALDSTDRTLIFDTNVNRWLLDDSDLTGITVRTEEPGEGIFNQIMGGLDGRIFKYDPAAIRDDDTDLSWDLWTPLVDLDQPRVVKQFGDVLLSVNPGGSDGGISVVPVANDATVVLAAEVIGAGVSVRTPFVLDLNAGDGQLGRNLGLRLSGTLVAADTARPQLYLWEPSFLAKSDDSERRATDWDALGYLGAKFIQGVVIRANTYGVDKTIVIQSDGAVDQITLVINHDGELTKEYPSTSQAAPGWPPFISHMVRIIGRDDDEWNFLEARFVWEPAPELATQWETQFTSHDLPGYFSVRDAVIAHESEGEIRFRVTYDDGAETDYTIPASGAGVYKRSYVVCQPGKGIAVSYQLRSGCPFRLYKRDCSVRVGPWGGTSGYMQTVPFGGPHRADGAAI